MEFEYHNPTQIIFGAGSLSRLGEVTAAYGKKALVVTGGGSVKRNGTFDRAAASLKNAGVSIAECSGVEPNPRIASVARGAKIAREEGCDVVIALRMQNERMNGALLPSSQEYFKRFGLTQETLRHAKPDVIVMHPGPINRGVEIDSAVADGPHSVILQQVSFGIAVRMAAMSIVASHDA